MPNIKSAKKRMRIESKRKLQNKITKTSLRTVVKKAKLAVKDDSQNKQEVLVLAIKKLDQAVSKGILHRNNAARKKSQLIKAQ